MALLVMYDVFLHYSMPREYTILEVRESNPACLNGDEHNFKNIMELPDHVNASKGASRLDKSDKGWYCCS